MKATTPIVPGAELPTTTYAKDQPEYEPLPVFRYDDGTVLSRWRLTWRERLRALFVGDVYLFQMTFGQRLQPVMLQVERPELS